MQIKKAALPFLKLNLHSQSHIVRITIRRWQGEVRLGHVPFGSMHSSLTDHTPGIFPLESKEHPSSMCSALLTTCFCLALSFSFCWSESRLSVAHSWGLYSYNAITGWASRASWLFLFFFEIMSQLTYIGYYFYRNRHILHWKIYLGVDCRSLLQLVCFQVFGVLALETRVGRHY